jgi:hypothetical protein
MKIFIQVVALIMTIPVILSTCNVQMNKYDYSTPISPSHEVVGQGPITLKPVWKQKFSPLISGFGKEVLECSQNKDILYVEGQLPTVSYEASIFALDSSNGNLIWSVKLPGNTVFSDKRVFTTHLEEITALDGKDGKVLWQTSLPFFSRGISKLFFYNGNLYAETSGSPRIVVLSEDGKILLERNSFESLSALYPDLPKFYLHESGPIVIDKYTIYLDSIYINVYEDDSQYPIIRIEDIVSNITPIKNRFLYLSTRGALEIYDPIKNKNATFATILPFIEFNNFYKAPDVMKMGYYVCYSEDNKMLYVLLGDSQELLAFKVNGLENFLKE